MQDQKGKEFAALARRENICYKHLVGKIKD